MNPTKIVLGGGVSKAGEILRSKVEETFKITAFPRSAEAIFRLRHLEMTPESSAGRGLLK